MFSLINSELRKILCKKRVLIMWILGLLFCSTLIGFDSSFPNYILEIYASLFDKTYGIAPVIGLIMMVMISSVYTTEYNSNMTGLINASKNGKKKVVIAKSVAGSIATSLVVLSMYLVMVYSSISQSGFKGLDIPLKNLWYFGNSGSNITVLQMIIILGITLILGCILFTQVTLALSAISNNAVMPFIIGGLFMGLPWIVINFLPQSIQKFGGLTPIWGMFSCQLVRYKSPMFVIPVLIVLFVISITVLPMITYKKFASEKR